MPNKILLEGVHFTQVRFEIATPAPIFFLRYIGMDTVQKTVDVMTSHDFRTILMKDHQGECLGKISHPYRLRKVYKQRCSEKT